MVSSEAAGAIFLGLFIAVVCILLGVYYYFKGDGNFFSFLSSSRRNEENYNNSQKRIGADSSKSLETSDIEVAIAMDNVNYAEYFKRIDKHYRRQGYVGGSGPVQGILEGGDFSAQRLLQQYRALANDRGFHALITGNRRYKITVAKNLHKFADIIYHYTKQSIVLSTDAFDASLVLDSDVRKDLASGFRRLQDFVYNNWELMFAEVMRNPYQIVEELQQTDKSIPELSDFEKLFNASDNFQVKLARFVIMVALSREDVSFADFDDTPYPFIQALHTPINYDGKSQPKEDEQVIYILPVLLVQNEAQVNFVVKDS